MKNMKNICMLVFVAVVVCCSVLVQQQANAEGVLTESTKLLNKKIAAEMKSEEAAADANANARANAAEEEIARINKLLN
jgi:hypothetical protein